MVERDRTGRGKQALWAAPVVVGAGVGVRSVAKGIQAGTLANPKSWFTKPAAMKGSVARSHAIASGMVQAGRTTGIDYLSQLDQMATNMSWMRLPKDVAPSAITEAMRASILSRGRLSLEEANRLSRQVISAPVAGTAAQPGGFNMALGAVKQYGDPGIFYRQLQGVIAGKRTPGVYFTPGELRDLTKQATGKWIYSGKGRLAGAIGTEQAGMVSRWLGAVPEASGWQGVIRGVREYPWGIRMARLQFKHPEVSGVAAFDVPLTEGWYRQGANLYSTNRMLVANQPVNFAEYQIKQITEQFLPDVLKDAQAGKMTGRLLKNRVTEFNADLSRYMLWTPAVSHPGMDIINQLNRTTLGVPELSPAALRASEVADPNAIMSGLWREGFYPPKSANQLASGKVWSGIDPRKFWAYGADFPFERLPMQHLRPFAPTKEALNLMSQRFGPGKAFRRDMPFLATELGQQMAAAGYKAPQLATAYAVPGTAGEAILSRQGLAAEELLLRRNMMRMYGAQTIITKRIGLQEAVASPEIQKWIQQAATGKVDPLMLERGQALGREVGTSRLITASRMRGVTEELIGMEMQGTEAVLQVRQSFVPREYAKIYGGLKATTRTRSNAVLNSIADRVGLVFLKENVDGYTFADGLLKNRSLLKQQMASGLAMITAARMRNVTDPRIAAEMEAFMKGGAAWVEASLPSELSILRKAQQWGIKGRALGLIGGMIPAAAGAGLIPGAEAARIYAEVGGEAALKSPFVLGLTTGWPGAFRGMQGAGQRGTMEPRAFMQLLAHDWQTSRGPAQELLAGEMLRSMRSYGPELTELHRAARSMAGETISGVPTIPLSEVGKTLVRPEGYILDVGIGGIKPYVPGSEALRQIDYFRVAQGDVLATDLQLAYNKFASAARGARDAGDSAKAIRSMEQAGAELSKAVIGATGMAMFGRGGGSGIGGAMRGEMVGSKMLQLSSIDPRFGAIAERTAEVSMVAGEEMYQDLFRAATSREERKEIARQWSALLKGETAPGILARHPTFGPYSTQPVNVRLSRHPLTRSEYFVRTPAQLKMAAQTEIGKIMADVSPNIGLAADFDDDFLIVKAIGDKKTADATRELLASRTYAQEYQRFAAETALLSKVAKTRAAEGAISLIGDMDKIAMGAQKLWIGKAEIGRISAPFTEAKLALGKYDPALLPQFNLWSAAMEQQIISGKHMKDAARQNVAQRVSIALTNIHRTDADMGELVKSMRGLFGTEIETGIGIKMAGQEWTFQSDPTAMFKRVRTAMQSAHESGMIATYRTLARGHTGQVKVGTLLGMVEEAQRGTSAMLDALALRGMVTPRGKMATMASSAISRLNQVRKEAGQIVKTWGKPVLYGLAGTAALAMLMGGPKTQPMLPPPPTRSGDTREQVPTSHMMSRRMLQGITPQGRDLRPESFTPSQGMHGRPTSPGMPTPVTYMTNQAPMRLRVVARAQGDYVPDRDSIIETLQRSGYPIGGDVRVTINDNRSKMTKQRVSEILEGF